MKGKAGPTPCQLLAVLALFLLGSACVYPGSATGAVLTVTDCGDTTPGGAPGQLRRLIADATAGDTIVVPACLITLTGAPLDIGKDLTLQGAGARRTIVDGGGLSRAFTIFLPATVRLADLMVRRGFAHSAGGIRNAGTLTLNRVIVRSNRVFSAAAFGGGIANDGTLTLVESAIANNRANAEPPGVSLGGGGIFNTGLLTLLRSTLSGNLSCDRVGCGAGGIHNAGTLAVSDSTVSGNTDGIFNVSGGAMSVVGTAIVANLSFFSSPGPPAGVGLVSHGAAMLTNTIIADNPGGQCLGTFDSAGGNLVTDDSCGLSGIGDAVVVNADLGPLGVHGGPTDTHPLLPGSPAIDTALPAACGPTDQRGMPRPQDGDGDGTAICDKGPFEFTPPIFADVAADHFARGAIEALRANGVTGGCGTAPLMFCPDAVTTRGQFAVLLLRALEGPAFTPPAATGLFADVPVGHPFAAWIEALFNQGITTGCAVAPLRFCPEDPVTRGQLAVLLLRALAVPGFIPPALTGSVFSDVPNDDPFAPWIEEFFQRGLTAGCQASPLAFCPGDAATRAQTAVFLVRAFDLGF
jgi:hypothetical protein